MSRSLANVDAKNRQQNWIKDGISILSKEILQKDSISEQISSAINQLSRYINAGMGVIYLYDSTEDTLKLEASYAYTESKNLPSTFKMGHGVVGQVAQDKKPILLTSASDALLIRTATTEYKALNTYTSPLIFEDKLVGVAEVASYNTFTPEKLEYVESALIVLASSFYASLQLRDKKRLETISITDTLTGLFNRGHFDVVTPQLLNRGKRNDSLFCFTLLDIDYFKKFNDHYGHQIGDEVLKKVSNVLQNQVTRKDDYCFRVGGEEFAIIFSADNKKKAFDFITKVKDSIENLEMRNKEGKPIDHITISAGLTCKKAIRIENVGVLFEETDKLLYMAKKAGRNRIIQNE